MEKTDNHKLTEPILDAHCMSTEQHDGLSKFYLKTPILSGGGIVPHGELISCMRCWQGASGTVGGLTKSFESSCRVVYVSP